MNSRVRDLFQREAAVLPRGKNILDFDFVGIRSLFAANRPRSVFQPEDARWGIDRVAGENVDPGALKVTGKTKDGLSIGSWRA